MFAFKILRTGYCNVGELLLIPSMAIICLPHHNIVLQVQTVFWGRLGRWYVGKQGLSAQRTAPTVGEHINDFPESYCLQ